MARTAGRTRCNGSTQPLSMKILITGICGFVGSSLAKALLTRIENLELAGVDNLLRAGSESNRSALTKLGVKYFHGDIRMRSDVDSLPPCDWVIDAAAQPSVLAGVDGKSSPQQLCEHNLGSTLNVLDYCHRHRAGFVLLSTSRVYSIEHLAAIPMRTEKKTFLPDESKPMPMGASAEGIDVEFSTRAPISLYGATKLASETMAAEYGRTFDFPVWINRCGVLAGAGQFGTAEQGIFSYWLHAHAAKRPLRFIGFGGNGHQARDAFHPDDLAELISIELRRTPSSYPIYNVGGGPQNTMSLAQLNDWCDSQFGPHAPQADTRPRPFDIPWFVMNNERITNELGWMPNRTLHSILDEIREHVAANPDWLSRCGAI